MYRMKNSKNVGYFSKNGAANQIEVAYVCDQCLRLEGTSSTVHWEECTEGFGHPTAAAHLDAGMGYPKEIDRQFSGRLWILYSDSIHSKNSN